MPQSGYTGISYPFRINSQGGVAMSTTDTDDATHIAESIEQILGTSFLERPMESEVYSSLDSFLFEPNDIPLQQLIRTQIVEDIERLDDRVSLSEDDINFKIEEENGVSYLYVDVNFKVTKYNTYYNSKIKVGEVNG